MLIDPALERPHVGYAIGRQVGNAVERNRIRRRLRVLMGRHGAHLPAGNYLIGVSPRSTQPTWGELDASVERLVSVIRAKVVTV
jgi:ribonuclease P protein component